MKIMVVGGGGREHAIIKKLKENKDITEIFALPGNGGIAADATCVAVKATDIEGIVKFAKENAIDYAVVAPDDPLVLGAVDALTEIGVPCFGPNKAAAIIEGSKVFSKNLMKKYNIPEANVIRHYDVTGKTCPEPYVRDIAAWSNFKKKLIEEEKPMVKVDNTPDAYAKDAIAWAIGAGILKGTEAGDYKLHSPVTRQDMLVFLYRAMK